MFVTSLILNDIETADGIANGDITFALSGSDSNISVGDMIRFRYSVDGKYLPHDVDSKLYVVTYVHIHDNSVAIVSLKTSISWRAYLYNVLDRAQLGCRACAVTMYSGIVYEMCYLTVYDDGSVNISLVDDRNVKCMLSNILDVVLM